MDAQSLFTRAWLDTFICLSCSGYKLETCFLWKNLFCSCRRGEVTAGTPALLPYFSQFSSGNVVADVGPGSCSCAAGYARCNAWSVWQLVTILLPPSRSCGSPKRGPRAHPLWISPWFPSRELMLDIQPLWFVRRGRGWIFTLMEGGKGGVFANNP